jgi:hypothetical protein
MPMDDSRSNVIRGYVAALEIYGQPSPIGHLPSRQRGYIFAS